jgi:hypothetical protein
LYQCFHEISKVEPIWFPGDKQPYNKKTFLTNFIIFASFLVLGK